MEARLFREDGPTSHQHSYWDFSQLAGLREQVLRRTRPRVAREVFDDVSRT